MKKRQNRTHPSESLSLLPLKVVLTHARNQVPAEAQISRTDANEELALQLIQMMKLQFKEDALPVHWMGSSTRLGTLYKEMVGTDV